jgi:hypothetical protein
LTTAVFIQAVPWWPERTINAVRLARETGGTVVWDTNQCAFDTWHTTLEMMGDQPGILLEDDVDLAPNWREQIEWAIASHRDQVIRFFSAEPDDLTIGSRAIPGAGYSMNQCTYFPATYAAQLLAWMGKRRPKRWLEYHDWILGEWLDYRHEEFWNHVPSLVQHRDYVSTIKPKRSTKRQSETFDAHS